MFWFKKKLASAESVDAGVAPAAPAVPATPATSPRSVMSRMNDHLLAQAGAAPTDSTDKLNSQIVQAVQFTNSQNYSYAPAQIAVAADMMISQAAGLVAQSAAGYFDGVSKLALAAPGGTAGADDQKHR